VRDTRGLADPSGQLPGATSGFILAGFAGRPSDVECRAL